jgi:MFS family permease
MALSSGTAVLGVGLGPLVAGFVAEATTWRWIFHVQTVVIGAILTVMAICFVETRADVVLRRKMLALNQWYDAHEQAGHFDHYHSPSSMLPQRKLQANGTAPPPASFGKQVAISLARPFRLLLTDPVVFFFSLWTAFSWWVLYICLSSVPLVFERSHRFDLAQANAVFVNSS